MTTFDLSGRVALVTGGASGISNAMAVALSKSGATTYIADVNEETGKKAVLEHEQLIFKKLDVTSEESVSSLVSDIVEESGRIDILFNGAGIMDFNTVLETTFADFERTIRVNLLGTFLVTKYVLPEMVKNKYGRIVNVVSGYANGAISAPGYSTSKGGLVALTKSLAGEMRDLDLDVSVNAIAPSATDTALWRRGRSEEVIENKRKTGQVSQPDDMTDVVLFLASPESHIVSGEIIGHRNYLLKLPKAKN